MEGKKVLMIGSHSNFFSANIPLLIGRGYDVTHVNSLESREIPAEKFDTAVVSGLNGWGASILLSVEADRRILYSSNFDKRYARILKLAGIETHQRSEPITRFLGGIN